MVGYENFGALDPTFSPFLDLIVICPIFGKHQGFVYHFTKGSTK